MGKGERRMTVLRVLALFVALSFYPFPFSPVPLSSSARAESVISTSTREGRLAVFDDVWSAINLRYYDRSFHGLDWEAQRAAFRPRAAEANSGQELYAVLRRMIASLNDPHTRVFGPEEKFDWWRPRFVTIGITVRDVGGLPTVVQVERGSAPQRAGIRTGDVIETVDGAAASVLINNALANRGPEVSAASRMRAFARLLDGPAETAVEVGWTGKDGSERSGQFRRYWQQRELQLRVRKVKGQYAVVEMDAFTNLTAANFANYLNDKLKGIRGVIVDLRANGGGDAEAMADVASAFLGAGFSLGQFTDRSGVSFTISTRSRSPLLPERIPQTELPLIVLTSERTSSAAEIFTAAMKTAKRATIIGSETCGCVLAIRTRHELPDGGLLDISELDYQTATGDRLEGHGQKPDETIALERSDLYSGRDRALESAISKLARLRSEQH